MDDGNPNCKKKNQIVLIGKDIDPEKLNQQLQECVIKNTKKILEQY